MGLLLALYSLITAGKLWGSREDWRSNLGQCVQEKHLNHCIISPTLERAIWDQTVVTSRKTDYKQEQSKLLNHYGYCSYPPLIILNLKFSAVPFEHNNFELK